MAKIEKFQKFIWNLSVKNTKLYEFDQYTYMGWIVLKSISFYCTVWLRLIHWRTVSSCPILYTNITPAGWQIVWGWAQWLAKCGIRAASSPLICVRLFVMMSFHEERAGCDIQIKRSNKHKICNKAPTDAGRPLCATFNQSTRSPYAHYTSKYSRCVRTWCRIPLSSAHLTALSHQQQVLLERFGRRFKDSLAVSLLGVFNFTQRCVVS